MAKAYVKLADTGTTFYDQLGRQKIVADHVELFDLNARVQEAVKKGQLIKMDKDEGAALYKKQQAKRNKKSSYEETGTEDDKETKVPAADESETDETEGKEVKPAKRNR